MTGYEQVRSVTAAIAGGQEADERVELALPETGVCGGAGLFDEPENTEQSGGGCCAAPTTLEIGIGAPTPASGGSDVVNRPLRDGPNWTRFVEINDGTKRPQHEPLHASGGAG
jgi:hypothetical protein